MHKYNSTFIRCNVCFEVKKTVLKILQTNSNYYEVKEKKRTQLYRRY